jgi:hypothetical protein
MLERTRLLGPELIAALERADEVLSSHDSAKRHAWRDQSFEEHATRAIIHLGNAILNKDDGMEIEASHGVIRAVMALEQIIRNAVLEQTPRKLCSSHAKFEAAREHAHETLKTLQHHQ